LKLTEYELKDGGDFCNIWASYLAFRTAICSSILLHFWSFRKRKMGWITCDRYVLQRVSKISKRILCKWTLHLILFVWDCVYSTCYWHDLSDKCKVKKLAKGFLKINDKPVTLTTKINHLDKVAHVVHR
jgi:hypothetical protein